MSEQSRSMSCADARDMLGAHLDGELPVETRAAIEAHLENCRACAVEFEALKRIASGLQPVPVLPPSHLWSLIEERLAPQQMATSRRGLFRIRGGAFAIAATILLASGVGVWVWNWGGGSSAEAAMLDFGELLDGVPTNAEKAFEDFLGRYHAREASVAEIKQDAFRLNFDMPDTLPGGFQRVKSYSLRFGDQAGAAAQYTRNGEFLGAIFHTPVHQEDFGTHKDYPCAIGKHRGHKVSVGEWNLVHLTDPTTCHCVLSKLDEKKQLPPIMAALAPSPNDDNRR